MDEAKSSDTAFGKGGPLHSEGIQVEPGWLDYNGHLNMAYYLVIFDRAIDPIVPALGLSCEPGEGPTLFAAEVKVSYRREVRADHVLSCRSEILRHDEKRIWTLQTLLHADGSVAATCENMHLHVVRGPEGPKVAPFGDDALQRMAALMAVQQRR